MPVDPAVVARTLTASSDVLLQALRAIRADTPQPVALALADRLRGSASWTSAWYFCRHTRKLPAVAVRALVSGWAAERTSESLVFLTLVDVTRPDADVEAGWARAAQLILDLNTSYDLGSAKWRAKLDLVRADEALLGAVQTAVAGAARPRADFVAALLRDASPASLDALTPLVAQARRVKDERLDLLRRLGRYAADTPDVRALLASLAEDEKVRAKASPVATLAQALPFLTGPFSLRVTLNSADTSFGHVPRVQGSVVLDSRGAKGFAVHLSERSGQLSWRTTSFDAQRLWRDELGLGRCAPLELPAWVARAAEKLGAAWVEPSVHSTLRGQKRAAAVAWLLSGKEPARPARRRKPRG